MMKALLTFLFCLPLVASAATSYTEWYCNSTGTNINAGSTTNAAATFSDANGNWDASTGIFICSAPSDLSAVNVGDWASVFVDGATTAVFVGRITTVVDATDTITVSVTIKTGTPPSTSATGRSIKIGGAWYGPWYSGATVDNLPFNFVNNLLTNTSQDFTRINIKADRIYATTNVVHSSNGPIRFQGYTNAPGDGSSLSFTNHSAKAWLTGSTVGAGHTLFTLSGVNCDVVDLTFATNGTSGSSGILLTITGAETLIDRCVFQTSRGYGLNVSALSYVNECEAFLCNLGNGVQGGINLSASGTTARRCISHNNAGTGSCGFSVVGGTTIIDCVADSNGRDGLIVSATSAISVLGSCFYGNGSNGINTTATSAILMSVENCNFIANGVGLTGAYAINSSGSLLRNGSVINCRFGTGTATNGSGGANILPGTGLDEIGSLGYVADVTPWVDPANGDFRINLAAAINAGRGSFTQTAAGYAGTIGYPDIGAAQATNAAAGATTIVALPMFRR